MGTAHSLYRMKFILTIKVYYNHILSLFHPKQLADSWNSKTKTSCFLFRLLICIMRDCYFCLYFHGLNKTHLTQLRENVRSACFSVEILHFQIRLYSTSEGKNNNFTYYCYIQQTNDFTFYIYPRYSAYLHSCDREIENMWR